MYNGLGNTNLLFLVLISANRKRQSNQLNEIYNSHGKKQVFGVLLSQSEDDFDYVIKKDLTANQREYDLYINRPAINNTFLLSEKSSSIIRFVAWLEKSE